MPPAGYPAFLQYLQSGRVSDSEVHPLKHEPLDAVVVDQLPESLSIGCTRTRQPGDGDLAKLLHPLVEIMSGHLTDPLDGFAEVLHMLREAIVLAPDVRIEQEAELQEPQLLGLEPLEQPAGLEGDEQAENHGEQCGERREGLEGRHITNAKLPGDFRKGELKDGEQHRHRAEQRGGVGELAMAVLVPQCPCVCLLVGQCVQGLCVAVGA